MTIPQILEELNLENGSNYKLEVLKKHKDNELLKRVLKQCYDKVVFTHGVTMKNIPKITNYSGANSLAYALTVLEQDFATRKVTGNAALKQLEELLYCLSKEDADIVIKVINRDLKINMGRTNINKVFKNLIVKPPYRRCDIGTDVNIKKNIDFNKTVYSQVKMDGTFRSASVDSGTIMSRSGNEDSFPLIEAEMKTIEIEGYVLLGEMTLKGEQDRSKGNGIINSITERAERQNDIIFTVWDMIPVAEYAMDKNQIKAATKAGTLTTYAEQFERLIKVFDSEAGKKLKNIQLVEYKIIKNMKEAYKHFQEVTERGDEGTVIKTEDLIWKDGTSRQQLKVKLVISAEVRVTGFIEGTKGTKRELTFGSLMFENDEGTIKGSTSGFTDELLEKINSERDLWIGKVIEVQFNNITKSRSSETYAFSHPRFISDRSDEKNSTDTLERCMEMKEMAMNLS